MICGSQHSVSGLDCIMIMMHPRVWRNAQKVTQYPDICSGGNPDIPFRKAAYCNEHFCIQLSMGNLYKPKKYKTFVYVLFSY